MKTNGSLKCLFAIMLLVTAFGAFAAAMSQNGVFVFTAPDKTSFWRTATNNVISLPVYYPKGAGSATLEVRGTGYFRTYSGLPEGIFDLVLPAPEKAQNENVYELKLVFDDGPVRMARLGVLAGAYGRCEGVTRCVFNRESSDWTSFFRRAVIPVAQETISLAVNGKDVPLLLDGARGWHVLCADRASARLELVLSDSGGNYSAVLFGYPPGFLLFFR